MTYRPPSHVPETRWARHLDAVMRDRGWSRVRLFEEVGAELGYAPKSRSGFLPLLIDREPTASQAAVLRQHFGEPPEEAAPVAGSASSDTLSAELVVLLLAKLDAQTDAITSLVGAIGAATASREHLEARVRGLEAELGLLRAQPGDGESSERYAPPTTGE